MPARGQPPLAAVSEDPTGLVEHHGDHGRVAGDPQQLRGRDQLAVAEQRHPAGTHPAQIDLSVAGTEIRGRRGGQFAERDGRQHGERDPGAGGQCRRRQQPQRGIAHRVVPALARGAVVGLITGPAAARPVSRESLPTARSLRRSRDRAGSQLPSRCFISEIDVGARSGSRPARARPDPSAPTAPRPVPSALAATRARPRRAAPARPPATPPPGRRLQSRPDTR